MWMLLLDNKEMMRDRDRRSRVRLRSQTFHNRDDRRDRRRVGLASCVIRTVERLGQCCPLDGPGRGRTEVNFRDPAATNDRLQVDDVEPAAGHNGDAARSAIDQLRKYFDALQG